MHLYYYRLYDNKLYRTKIKKETKAYYFTENNIKISKKTMRSGSGYSFIHYYLETPELIEKYKETLIYCKFKSNLKKLEKIESIEKMKVINELLEGLEV